ncbi:MAG: DUF433 domain-containing protein, partial [Chloroflexota bacterium]
MSAEQSERRVVSRDPDIHGGDAVFAGSRVPVQILIDYLEGGEGLELFLDQYPTVSRDQAEAAVAI